MQMQKIRRIMKNEEDYPPWGRMLGLLAHPVLGLLGLDSGKLCCFGHKMEAYDLCINKWPASVLKWRSVERM
jgi:hypothetical protein